MDLDLERIAFGSVAGVTGAAIAAGTGRECNQQINLGKKLDEIACQGGRIAQMRRPGGSSGQTTCPFGPVSA